MSPYELAKRVYDTEPCARPFDVDLRYHLDYGYVHATPYVFVMARPVRSTSPARDLLSPWIIFPDPDAWMVWLAAGDLQEMFRLEPFQLPYYVWERNNQLRRYTATRVHQLIDRFTISTCSTIPQAISSEK